MAGDAEVVFDSKTKVLFGEDLWVPIDPEKVDQNEQLKMLDYLFNTMGLTYELTTESRTLARGQIRETRILTLRDSEGFQLVFYGGLGSKRVLGFKVSPSDPLTIQRVVGGYTRTAAKHGVTLGAKEGVPADNIELLVDILAENIPGFDIENLVYYMDPEGGFNTVIKIGNEYRGVVLLPVLHVVRSGGIIEDSKRLHGDVYFYGDWKNYFQSPIIPAPPRAEL